MNINELTIGQAKEIAAMFGGALAESVIALTTGCALWFSTAGLSILGAR